MIDLDAVYVEAKHPHDRPPVALMETAEVFYHLQPADYYEKSSRILTQLGKAANVPVFLTLYKADYSRRNPADPSWPDIEMFYVKQCYPWPTGQWKVMNPEQYAAFLVWLREGHVRVKRTRGQQIPLAFSQITQSLNDDDLARLWYAESQLANQEVPA